MGTGCTKLSAVRTLGMHGSAELLEGEQPLGSYLQVTLLNFNIIVLVMKSPQPSGKGDYYEI